MTNYENVQKHLMIITVGLEKKISNISFDTWKANKTNMDSNRKRIYVFDLILKSGICCFSILDIKHSQVQLHCGSSAGVSDRLGGESEALSNIWQAAQPYAMDAWTRLMELL